MEMIEQELKDIWKDASPAEKIKLDIARLLIELKGRISQVENATRISIKTELIASIFGLLLFHYFFYEIPFLLPKFVSILSMLWLGLRILKLKNKQQCKSVNLSFCFLDQLENQKADYQLLQSKLSTSSYYYYISISLIINLIFTIGLSDSIDYRLLSFPAKNLWVLSNIKIITLIGLSFFYALTAWTCKRTLKKIISTLIPDIERVLSLLETNDQR